MWRKRSRRINNRKQQAAAVRTQHLCRHHHHRSAWPFAVIYLFPSRLLGCQRSFYRLLILLASHRIHEPQSTCILPELVLYTATSKGYNSEYTPWTTSTARSYAALWSQDPAARSCSINSSTVSATVHILKKNMQKIQKTTCLLYTSPSPRDATLSRMPSSA